MRGATARRALAWAALAALSAGCAGTAPDVDYRAVPRWSSRAIPEARGDLRTLPDGKRAAVVEVGGHVTLLDLATQKKVHRVRLHGGAITALVWTPDSKGLLTSSTADAEIRRWDIAKLEKPIK